MRNCNCLLHDVICKIFDQCLPESRRASLGESPGGMRSKTPDFESVYQQEQNGQPPSSYSDNVPLLAGIKWAAEHEVQAGRP